MAEERRKRGSLFLLEPGTSAVFGDESAKVPGDDRGVQGIASLDVDPVRSRTLRRDGLCSWRRCDPLPMLAVFCAQDGSRSADDPGNLFRWRGSSKQIRCNAARLRPPGLSLIDGVLDAPAGPETPEGATIRGSEHKRRARCLC